jgi:hypothetical protein
MQRRFDGVEGTARAGCWYWYGTGMAPVKYPAWRREVCQKNAALPPVLQQEKRFQTLSDRRSERCKIEQ